MTAWRRVLGVVRRAEAGDPPTDGELLSRFAAARDQAAFELLVWRHAAMVFGVCRRAVRDEHLAEDAFQAVFLVLARKAGSVRGANLAGWLFRVARRVGAKAARRAPTPQLAVDPIAKPAPDELERRELQAILDDEIARLPDRFRVPVLLCYLGGLSTEEAARRIGVPRGTILSRLSTARQRLAVRLTRRGVTVPAVALAPAAVVNATVRNAVAFVTKSPAPAIVPASLAEGVLRTMTLHKLVPVAAACALVAGLVSGVGFKAGPGPAVAIAQQPVKSTLVAPPPSDDDRKREREKLTKLTLHLRDQIDADERVIRQTIEANRLTSGAESAGRIHKLLTQLDTELFTVEKDLLRQTVEKTALDAKITGRKVIVPESVIDQAVSADERVRAVIVKLSSDRKLLDEAVESGVKTAITARSEVLSKRTLELQQMRLFARDEVVISLQKAALADLVHRAAVLADSIEVSTALFEKLRGRRDVLERQLSETATVALNFEGQKAALESKRELLRRLESQLALVEVEHQFGGPLPTLPPVSGVDRKSVV